MTKKLGQLSFSCASWCLTLLIALPASLQAEDFFEFENSELEITGSESDSEVSFVIDAEADTFAIEPARRENRLNIEYAAEADIPASKNLITHSLVKSVNITRRKDRNRISIVFNGALPDYKSTSSDNRLTLIFPKTPEISAQNRLTSLTVSSSEAAAQFAKDFSYTMVRVNPNLYNIEIKPTSAPENHLLLPYYAPETLAGIRYIKVEQQNDITRILVGTDTEYRLKPVKQQTSLTFKTKTL